jgi:hypothetical protein
VIPRHILYHIIPAQGFPLAVGITELAAFARDRPKTSENPSLAATDPHHKHILPDIKHHRVPAPDLPFTRPYLPFLIQEIEQLVSG